MFCANCGNEMQKGDKVCAQCGTPVAEGFREVPEIEFEAPVEETPATAVPTYTEEAQQSGYAVPPVASEVKVQGQKGSSKKLVFAIVAAVIVLLAGVGVVKGAEIANAIRQSTMDAKEYYQYVEGKAAEDAASDVADAYNKYVLEMLKTDRSEASELKLGFGKDVTDLLEDLSGMDFSWLSEISMTVDRNSKGDSYYTGLSALLGKEELLGMKLMLDMENEKVYVQIPELNEKYLAVDLEMLVEEGTDMDIEEFMEMVGLATDIYNKLPDKKKVESLLQKYVSLAISCIKDVEEEEDTLSAGDVSADYTVLVVTIDDGTLRDMAETVIEAMMDDEELKEVIIEASAIQEEMDGEDVYDALMDELDEVLEEVDEIQMDEEYEMKIWVDSKGEIRGRSLELDSKYDSFAVSYAIPRDGKKAGIEVEAEMEGVKVKLEGNAKQSGGEWDGTADLKVSGVKVAEIVFENAKFEDELAGTFVITPGKLVREALEGMDDIPFEADDATVKLVLDMNEKKSSVAVSLFVEEEMFATLSASYETGDGKKVSFPAEKDTVVVEKEEDLMEYAEDIDLDALLEGIEGAGVPEELLELIVNGMKNGFSSSSETYCQVCGNYDDCVEVEVYGEEMMVCEDCKEYLEDYGYLD